LYEIGETIGKMSAKWEKQFSVKPEIRFFTQEEAKAGSEYIAVVFCIVIL